MFKKLLLVGFLSLVFPLVGYAQNVQQEQPCGFFIINVTNMNVDVGIQTGPQSVKAVTTLRPQGHDVVSGPCGPSTVTVLLAVKIDEDGNPEGTLINGKSGMRMVVPLIPRRPKTVLVFPEGTYIPGVIEKNDPPPRN